MTENRSSSEILRDLAARLFFVPVSAGVDGGDISDLENIAKEIEVLRSHLSDDLLQRLAVEHGWPHPPDNPLGKWCCTEHQEAFHRGDLFA